MFSIIKKEFFSFFSSFLGVGIMIVMFIALGFFTWIFDGNLLDFGYAEMGVFFDIIPWFLMLFIPSLTMRLFAEECENKSIDLLRILPISNAQIILGKILGAFLVICVILIPTLLYVFSIKKLSINFDLDYSIIIGQYLSLLLLSFTFVQISTLASLFSNKQSIAFVISIVFNYIFWEGSLQLNSILPFKMVDWDLFSLRTHFFTLSNGLIRFSEVFFFIGLNLVLFNLEVVRFKKVI